MDLSTLHSQIESALRILVSLSPPEVIGETQTLLLQWEEHHTDEYVVCLLSLTGCYTATIRLAAILSLKAAVTRRWKDRGRGKLARRGAHHLLSESVKHAVRLSTLQLICEGFVHSFQELSQMVRYPANSPIEVKCIANIDTLSSSQAEFIQDKQLQTNAVALISKIGRMDLPLTFHELIPSLISGIQHSREAMLYKSNSYTACEMFRKIQFNISSALEALLDEMSTQRLLVNKKYRQEICKLYLGKIVELAFIPALQLDLSNVNACESAISSSRIVSFMMMSSFPKLIEDQSTAVVVENTLGIIHKFLSHWLPYVLQESMRSNMAVNIELAKLLCVQCNFIVELQSNYASHFFKYGNVFLQLFYELFSSIVEEINLMHVQQTVNEILTAFLLFMARYISSSTENDAAAELWGHIISPTSILSMTRHILLLFSAYIYANGLPQNDEYDGEYWPENPEGFYQWEMQRSSEDDIGCACQNLFLALIESNCGKEIILPWFVELLKNVSAQQVAINVESGVAVNPEIVTVSMPLGSTKMTLGIEDEIVMQYDAVWTAVGLSGGLIECNDFNYMFWFNAVIRPSLSFLLESKPDKRRLPVLRRRLIWLIPTNVQKLDVPSLHSSISMLVSTLTQYDSQNDVCVRLTAVQSLEVLLPYCEESHDVLKSIVDPIVPAVYALAEHCSEVENRTACLEFIPTVILYVKVTGGELSNNALNSISSPLLDVWDNATGQNILLKRNVMGILSCLASYIGPDQVSLLYPLALPMISASFQSDDHVFLVEDALRIWYVFLRLSKSYSSHLGELFVHASKLSEEQEYVIALSKITECYIVIGHKDFLNAHGGTLQTMLENLVGEVSPRGQAYITLVTEVLLRLYPLEGGQLLMQCGVVKTYLDACKFASLRPEESEPDRVIVLYLTTLARIYLASPELLHNSELAGGLNVHELIALYILKFKVAGNGAFGLLFQKLWAMLLLSFYPPSASISCSPIVLNSSSEIFPLFTHVIKNVHSDRSNLLAYEVEYDEAGETFDIPQSENDLGRETEDGEDIVIETNFQECVVLKIRELPVALGQEGYHRFIANTSNEALEELNDAIEKV